MDNKDFSDGSRLTLTLDFFTSWFTKSCKLAHWVWEPPQSRLKSIILNGISLCWQPQTLTRKHSDRSLEPSSVLVYPLAASADRDLCSGGGHLMGVAGKHIGGNFKRHACKPKASSLGRKITGFDINVFQNYKKKKNTQKVILQLVTQR